MDEDKNPTLTDAILHLHASMDRRFNAVDEGFDRMEARFDGNLIDQLLAAGHDVEVLSDAYSDVMGHAGAALLHKDGTCEAAHDPRADGGAAGA